MQVQFQVGQQSGTRTWFLYAGGQLVSEFMVRRCSPQADAASNTYSSPTSPGSAPADSASTLLYQHSDHLTTRVTTDNAGTLSNQQAHYPYGEPWYATGAADPSVQRKFTSYRKETDSSLATGQINYAVARYHGARIGRFHRADPNQGYVGNPQRLNRYSYVIGDTTNRSDPTGLDFPACQMPLDVFLIYNLPWVGLGDEPPPIVNPYAFGGAPGDACSGGVYGGAPSVPVCISPQVPTQMFTGGGPGIPPVPVFGCALPQGQGRRCFAKMRSRIGAFNLVFTNGLTRHAWWYVKDSSGEKGIISGDGLHPPLFLNVYYTGGMKSRINADSATAGREEWDSGSSEGHCQGVDAMVRAAKSFPRNAVAYAFAGPNSNSVASCMMAVGGFAVRPEPSSFTFPGWRIAVSAGSCPVGY